MTDMHGGNVYNKNVRLDFSANINPLGIPEGVKKAFVSSLDYCEKYPDHNCTELKKAIAEHESCSENLICVGNGAADLIYRIVHTFRPKKAVIVSPTFSEYEKALCEIGCDISFYNLNENNSFDIQNDFLNLIDDDIDMIYITSPNNPTGRIISADLLSCIADKCLKKGCILAADECFMDFSENSDRYSIKNAMNENVIILKAFTKIYAMAGIRLGYAVCGDKTTAEKISQNGQYWSVSAVAQQCGIAALREKEYVRKSVEMITAERRYLENELENLGFKVYHSFANYILFRTDIKIYEYLLDKGILIRKCGNYRELSDNYYRIAVRTHSENLELISTMEKCIYG